MHQSYILFIFAAFIENILNTNSSNFKFLSLNPFVLNSLYFWNCPDRISILIPLEYNTHY